MTKQELITEAAKILFEDSSELSRDEYRDFLEEMKSQIEGSLSAMDEEDQEDE